MLSLDELRTLIVVGRSADLLGDTEHDFDSEHGSYLDCLDIHGLMYCCEYFPNLLGKTRNPLIVVERVVEDGLLLWVCENVGVLRVADPKGEIVTFRDEAWRALVGELHLGQTETLEYTSSGFRFVSTPDLERTTGLEEFASLDQIFRGEELVLVSYPEGGLAQ